MSLRAKAEVQAAHTNENAYLLAEEVHIYKRNSKGILYI